MYDVPLNITHYSLNIIISTAYYRFPTPEGREYKNNIYLIIKIRITT